MVVPQMLVPWTKTICTAKWDSRKIVDSACIFCDRCTERHRKLLFSFVGVGKILHCTSDFGGNFGDTRAVAVGCIPMMQKAICVL
jgi:hypothetical protein